MHERMKHFHQAGWHRRKRVIDPVPAIESCWDGAFFRENDEPRLCLHGFGDRSRTSETRFTCFNEVVIIGIKVRGRWMFTSNLTKDFETVTKTEMERRRIRRGNRSFCSNARDEEGALRIIIKEWIKVRGR